MKNRRAFLMSLTTGLVALAVLAAPVIADELIGYISKVDAGGMKITVTNDDGDKEIAVNGDTEYVTKKGTSKLDLEKLAKNVEKAKAKNNKGLRATITHDKGTASKIEPAKKKAN